MPKDPLTWSEANRLLRAVGREDNLARRLETERRARGWSQERLASEMKKVGCPLPQSAISKIEKPAATGRRAITIEEAICFSRVFETSLVELLLPPGSITLIEAMRDLAAGPDLLRGLIGAQAAYDGLVKRTQEHARLDPAWRLQLADELESAIAGAQNLGQEPMDSVRVVFLRDVIEGVRASEER